MGDDLTQLTARFAAVIADHYGHALNAMNAPIDHPNRYGPNTWEMAKRAVGAAAPTKRSRDD